MENKKNCIPTKVKNFGINFWRLLQKKWNFICAWISLHPQSQGTVESYNKEIRRLLLEVENSKCFSIYKDLPDVINIYNENIHASTKFKPIFLFESEDKNIKKKH